jgi:FolB domain-containing protein
LKTDPEYDGDVIRIERIELLAHIGVPDDERSQPQRLTINVAFWPNKSGPELNDDIARAVNYAAVCAEVRKFVGERRDKLIETLADKLAFHLLQMFGICRITIELRKYILPDVEFVSVTVTRERAKE